MPHPLPIFARGVQPQDSANPETAPPRTARIIPQTSTFDNMATVEELELVREEDSFLGGLRLWASKREPLPFNV